MRSRFLGLCLILMSSLSIADAADSCKIRVIRDTVIFYSNIGFGGDGAPEEERGAIGEFAESSQSAGAVLESGGIKVFSVRCAELQLSGIKVAKLTLGKDPLGSCCGFILLRKSKAMMIIKDGSSDSDTIDVASEYFGVHFKLHN